MDMKLMDVETIFNSSLFISNATGNNSALQLPLWTILEVSVSSIGMLANSLIIVVIMFSSLRTSVFMNSLMSLALFDTIFLITAISTEVKSFSENSNGPSPLFCRIIFFKLKGNFHTKPNA